MDPRLQASFIPKKPLMEHSSMAVKQPRSMGIFMVGAVIVFVVSLCLAVGVFVYNLYLNGRISSLTNSINSTEQNYSSSSGSLAQYSRMDDRLKTASQLLQDHVAVSLVFPLLEQNTAQNVQLTSFTFSVGAGTTTPAIDMSGIARSFNSVSVQSNVFSSSPVIQDPLFSGISLDTQGDVLFNVTASLNPDVIDYVNSLPASSTSSSTSTF